jgi:hypothetical protein
VIGVVGKENIIISKNNVVNENRLFQDKNAVNITLINHEKDYLSQMYIKLGLIKDFV